MTVEKSTQQTSSSSPTTISEMEGSQSEYPDITSTSKRTQRFKPIWRLLLISNLALGAYIFAMARKKSLSIEDKRGAKKEANEGKAIVETFLDASATASVPETPSPLPVVLKLKEPIPEDQQRELFKWILEEKRKIKPKDPEEKKRIDEEKAILKQFIRAKSIPNF